MTELNFSKRLTIGLFIIGTFFLLLFATTLSVRVGLIGYIYTGLAFLVATAYIIVLIVRISRQNLNLITGLKSIGIMLLNIPVALLYFFLVMMLINIARITFENTTGQDLSSIKIIGCDNREIKSLKNGESKTIWINIPGDCLLEIEYQIGGELKTETVAGYMTNSGGVIATYKIGSNQDIFL